MLNTVDPLSSVSNYYVDDVDIAFPVVGFLNASFSGFEQGPGHSVPVGYLKGGTVAGENLVFNVGNIPGTASEFTIIIILYLPLIIKFMQLIAGEGSQFDYTVSTLRVRALANGQISNVILTFHVDTIAQELNETFTLTLDPLVSPNSREGLFFRNTIEVIIVNDECN